MLGSAGRFLESKETTTVDEEFRSWHALRGPLGRSWDDGERTSRPTPNSQALDVLSAAAARWREVVSSRSTSKKASSKGAVSIAGCWGLSVAVDG
jgi:hypothetical protein